MIPLSQQSLPRLRDAPGLVIPTYDRSRLTAGIVHIGVGNFHRAHQAMAVDSLLQQGLAHDFAICGVGLLPGDARMRDVMRAQDGLYVLELRHPDGRREARVIGSVIDYLFHPDEPQAVIERLADPGIRIVSLTITEGGYRLDQADVLDDVAHPDRPTTVFGIVAAGLRRRREAGIGPFTVMSCDNLPGNGDVARQAFTSFAAMQDPEFATWMGENVAFPNSMVDRITPVTTEEVVADVRDDLGIADGWPVASEPFFQWVLEDSFSTGRPPFERAGVQLVEDVIPYELMKLRLLNASHQALAFFGYLAGYRLVDEAMKDADLRRFVSAYMAEAVPTLPPVPGIDLAAYRQTLLERFSNPAIRDTLQRLCAETSDRIPRFLVPVIKDNIAAGRDTSMSAAICASWARYAEGVDEQGGTIDIVDSLAGERRGAALRESARPGAFLENTALFGDIGASAEFREAYVSALRSLHELGAKATYANLAGHS
jgi:mannitol 2-dehydrogenase